jgi:thiol-disulfide isomerase/thioredoxin
LNRNVIIILCIVVGVTALLLLGKHGSKQPVASDSANMASLPPGAGDPPAGSLAPDFTLPSLPDGKSVQLSSLRGKAILVNFWATWCGPCKIEMPWLEDMQKKYGPQGFQILGVAMDDTDDTKPIIDFAKKMGVSYTILKGTDKVGDLYGGVDRLPLSYFVDRSGKIVHELVGLPVKDGHEDKTIIEDAIKQALGSGK